MFIQHGRAGITMANFAIAVGISQPTIRRLICDLDHLFGQVLTEHLNAILADLSQVATQSPDFWRARRAAYFRATRGASNLPLPVHALLNRGRFALPPDELEGIERQRDALSCMLVPEHGDVVMTLLDCPTTTLAQVEAMIAGLQTAAEQPQPKPSPAVAEADPTESTSERLKILTEQPSLGPLPILLPEPPPAEAIWAAYSDAECREATNAHRHVPLLPPQPRPTWIPTMVPEQANTPAPSLRPLTHDGPLLHRTG